MTTPLLASEVFEAPIIDRINLGYVLKPINSFQVSNANANMLFSFELPDPTPATFQSITRDCAVIANTTASSICRAYVTAYTSMLEMRQKAELHIGHAVNLAYELADTLQNDTRSKRQFPSFLTKIFSSLTGLAAESQVDVLQQSIKEMQKTVGTAANVFAVNQEHIATVVKMQTQRLDAIQNFSIQVQHDVNGLVHTLMTSQFQQNTINKLNNQISQMVFRVMLIISDVNALYQALQSLFAGSITPHLVPHAVLQDTLYQVSNYLIENQPHLQIVHQNPLHYYRTNSFVLFRQGNQVFVQLDCPITSLAEKFIIYKLERIPLLTPGSKGFFTQMNTDIVAIAVTSTHYLTFLEEAEIVAVPKVINLNMSPLTLRDINYPTCATALWRGNAEDLHTFCEYHVINGYLPAQIIRISPTKLFVSNITRLMVQCDKSNFDKSKEVSGGKQILITIPCGCEVIANQFWLPRRLKSCNDTRDNFTATNNLHAINYMYLKQFLTEDLSGISPNAMYKNFPNISLPALKVNQLREDTLIALSEESKFDMLKAVNATKFEKQAYRSLGDLAMQQIGSGTSDYSSISDVASPFLSVLTIGMAAVVIYLFFKIRTLAAIVALSQGRYGVQATEIQDKLALKYTIPTISTVSPYNLVDLKNDIISTLPVEIMILFAIIALLLISGGYVAYKLYQRHYIGPQTSCVIQIGNLTQHVNIKWTMLLHPPNFYTVYIQSTKALCQARVLNQNWPISKARLILANVEVQLRNTALDLNSILEVKNELSFFEARKVIHIIQEAHFIALLMLDKKGSIKSCTRLRAFDQLPPNAQSAPLYPMLLAEQSY
jgi:hypothetical protein